MKNYPVGECRSIRWKVGLTEVYVCGNLHRWFYVIYDVPGDWQRTGLKWCDTCAQAFVEILLRGYELVADDWA